MSLAAMLGRFLGAMLREMLPVLVQLYKEFRRDTAEFAADDPALRKRLVDVVQGRDSNDPRGVRPTSVDPADNSLGKDMGEGERRRPDRK